MAWWLWLLAGVGYLGLGVEVANLTNHMMVEYKFAKADWAIMIVGWVLAPVVLVGLGALGVLGKLPAWMARRVFDR